MEPIDAPVRFRHPKLRPLAVLAAGTRRVISSLAVSANDLEDPLNDVPPAEPVLPDYSMPCL